jgi:hypothetical protein
MTKQPDESREHWVDMSDFPDDVMASAKRFEDYQKRSDQPHNTADWMSLAHDIGIPQDHLEIILAGVWGRTVEEIRDIYKNARARAS